MTTTMEAGTAAGRDRRTVPDVRTWRLADLYPDAAAWRAALDAAVADLPALREPAGQLGTSAARLAEALEHRSRLQRTLLHLFVYAGLRADEDTRDAEAQGRQQEMQQVYACFNASLRLWPPTPFRCGTLSGGRPTRCPSPRSAGVDMTGDEPLDRTMARMHHVMDAMEAILDAGA